MAKHKRSTAAGPDLRARLRARLIEIRAMVIEANGPEALEVMGRAYDLDRIDALDRGDPVRVVLYEVFDHTERPGANPHAVCTLDPDGRLRSDLPATGRG